MKKFLGPALALSLLLNAALLLRKPPASPPPAVRTRVIERTLPAEPPQPVSMPAPTPVVAPMPTAPLPAVVPAAPPLVQLLAAPSDVASGATLKVTCSVVSGKTMPRHWIGLYAVGATVSTYSTYLMVHESPEYAFKAPRAPGTYEFRYVLDDDATVVAASNPFQVTDEPLVRPLVDLQSGTTYVKCGGEIPAAWALLSGRRSPQDWIGLYPPGAKNEDFLAWRYVPDSDRGQMTLKAPDKPGTYEIRYLLDNGYESVATSIRIVVFP